MNDGILELRITTPATTKTSESKQAQVVDANFSPHSPLKVDTKVTDRGPSHR